LPSAPCIFLAAILELAPEVIMHSRKFARAVSIFIGLGFPHAVGSAREAFELLNDWPSGGRGPEHEAAIDACRAALACECDDETARQAFEAFARVSGILAPEKPAALVQTADTKSPTWIPRQ
jgi:hypothetical protein